MKNYLLALLIFIGYLSPIQSVIASEDEHEGEEGISKSGQLMTLYDVICRKEVT